MRDRSSALEAVAAVSGAGGVADGQSANITQPEISSFIITDFQNILDKSVALGYNELTSNIITDFRTIVNRYYGFP